MGRGGTGMGRGGAGRGGGGSKKCKPIPAPPRGAGLKSHPIPAPPPLRSGENPHGAKQGGAGQAGRGKIAIPVPNHCSGIAAFYILRDKGSLKELHVICKSTRSSSFHDQDAC